MALGKKLSPLLLGLVLLIGLLAFLNWPQEQTGQRPAKKLTPVKVYQVTNQLFPITIDALGTAKANESVTLTAQVADTVTRVLFDDGDKVKAGQLLVQLNNKEEIARVAQLQVSLEEAKRQLSRINNLAKSSAASEQLLDEQQALVKSLEAQIAVANAQLDDLQIKAPFSGRLGIRRISVGSLVRPADEITTLDDISVVKVDFNVAENHLASMAIGQKVTATSVAYPGREFSGEIAAMDSRIDPVTRSMLSRAVINNPDSALRPGMLMQVTIEKQVLDTLVVPEEALVPNADKQFVYVVAENNVVSEREVIVGERRPGWVQIVKGLNRGEQIIVEGTLRVRDGSEVRVLNRDTLES
ncbi:efflux RND transporter periplasmic adaptor subunit [Alteromonas lipolytica]|uniref:Efflux transporter periplasmic adaptor subunit n=1 Tax=Alteromonas lipolytica TaxID=1856405 RepID=A0A1E8FDP3_9ALTE|nr:efflux RND transporter periplasmic adaptor subunit [Alteromonas lipolytica]OFI33708.1 efflux transporter periplasmic adaptor subunit [Alteromonas lipolytica]GGF69150.1 MexH family multidrug efflux RND transporter periplasmic adaptor subunit [Alteromonas lipolytica]